MGTVVGKWRLNTMILIFVMLTVMYTINGLFYGIETDEYGYIKPTNGEEIEVNETDLTIHGKSAGKNFINLMFGIGDFLTFGNIDNEFARFIITLFTSVCWITIGYIIYTFVKEWVPLT